MPELLELVAHVCQALGLPEGYFNHALLSFHSDGHNGHIETHRDLAHSAEEESDHEGKAVIAMLNVMQERTMIFADPAAPASISMKTLQPDIIHAVPFGHGHLIALKPPLNQQVKHGIPQDKTTGWRCSVVLRRVTKHWVNPTTGYYKVNGDRLLIKNVKDSEGNPSEFIRQLPLDAFLNVVPETPFEPTICPPPILAVDAVRELVMTEAGLKSWDWGPQYKAPGFSQRAGLPWWRIAFDRQYISWLTRSAHTHPAGWLQLQKYLQSIMDSALFRSLDQSFATDDEKFNYVRDSLQAENLYIRSVPTKIRRTVDATTLPDDEFEALGQEEFGGRTFDTLLSMDKDGAMLFAQYVQRKVATPMNTPRKSSSSGDSSPLLASAAVPPVPKARAKARAVRKP